MTVRSFGTRICIIALALTPALTPRPADAQAYPAKPVRIAMPFSTGGTDLVTRWLALKLAPGLGQQIVPEPRTGAGGNLAFEAVARAAPDGYSLLMAPPPFVINPNLYAKVGYDPLRDFAPIMQIGSIPCCYRILRCR